MTNHIRFTTEEHLQILLLQKKTSEEQDRPYREWEHASFSINWFDGESPVSLDYVKFHMPRAVLLSIRFPVDRNPKVVKADVDKLLAAEAAYTESTKSADELRSYFVSIANKYGMTKGFYFDQDMGGATGEI